MRFEWPSKQNRSAKQTREAMREVTEKADPTTYSNIAPPELIQRKKSDSKEYGTRIETENGSYYEITKNTELQQLTSRTLKGIVNVADVISVPQKNGISRYYSREIPLEKIENDTNASEIRADLFILYSIFGDRDHSEDGLNLSEKEGKVAYFDFDGAIAFPADIKPSPILLGKENTKMASLFALQKLESLRVRLEGEDGKKFLAAILREFHTPLDELFITVHQNDYAQYLQKLLLDRIDRAKFAAEEVGSRNVSPEDSISR